MAPHTRFLTLPFAEEGIEGLLRDKTRPPGIPPVPQAKVHAVVERTLREPPGAVTHWTGRAMAKAMGLSLRTIQRIWAAHKLQPHRIRTFKRSNDPDFAAKLDDVVGLYMNPPRHAAVVSIDEKSQIQALDRTQPGLPLKRGKCATLPHDYKRHGTTTLFAALSVLEGKVIGRCAPRHRHQEFIRFIATVERSVPAGKVIHAILDNYAAHKHPQVLAWLAEHPRWTFHFTPTSCSWLNAVEGFFSKLTRQSLKRGVFRSVDDLESAITRYIAATNRNPKPLVWTATAKIIQAKLTLNHPSDQCTSFSLRSFDRPRIPALAVGRPHWIFSEADRGFRRRGFLHSAVEEAVRPQASARSSAARDGPARSALRLPDLRRNEVRPDRRR